MNRESIREGPNQHEQNNDFHSRIHSHFCKNVARTAGPGFANASPNGRPLLPTRLLLEKGDKRHENVYMRMKRLMKMLASVAYELRQCFAERRPASLDPPVSRERAKSRKFPIVEAEKKTLIVLAFASLEALRASIPPAFEQQWCRGPHPEGTK